MKLKTSKRKTKSKNRSRNHWSRQLTTNRPKSRMFSESRSTFKSRQKRIRSFRNANVTKS